MNHRYNRSSVWMAAMLLIVMLVAAGCGQKANSAKETSKPQSTEQAGVQNAGTTPAPGSSGEEVRTINHVMGETQIKGTPVRIVSLYQGANDVAVAYGIKPVGIVESWLQKPVYEYLRPELGDVQQIGTEVQPNLEEIYKLKPDVIFANKTRHEAIYDQLSQIAPTVMTDLVYDWKGTVKLMGEVMNQQDKSDKLLADWDNRVADFKQKMGDKLPIEATITNFREDHARIFYMGYAGGILKELGFTRPPGHDAEVWGVQLTSKENIPDMNADVIFNFNSGNDEAAVQKLFSDWTSHPLWKNLDAVKNNQVYQVDEVSWNMAGGIISANQMLDSLYKMFNLTQ
ncbi:ABC transporter substrate-binding protein [Paenibacillus piscarius]|uniref:ABC transporter substrate-binding protein n=1 Tax=Paenibacillus piscarius TaxID=1089681 RepID=UPI001EE7AD4A|nr:iron-siderophore ABC transporter substrate-binding protein [Paenibacillus piscarius]